MEQDNGLEQEVKAIYQAIQEREACIQDINDEMDKEENPKRQRYSRLLFYTSILVVALSYAFIQIELLPRVTTVIIAVIGVSIGYLLVIAYLVVSFFKIKEDLSILIKSPLSLLFDGFHLTAGNDVAFAQALQQYSTRSLAIVKSRLSNQSTTVQHRVGSLVGPLSKLGLLPGLLALSITLFKPEHHQVTITIAIVFLVLYVISFRASVDLPRLQFYADMLEDEIAIRTPG